MTPRIAHLVGLVGLVSVTVLLVSDLDHLGIHAALLHTTALVGSVVAGSGWLSWEIAVARSTQPHICEEVEEAVKRAVERAVNDAYALALVHGAERATRHLTSVHREDD